MGWHGARRPGAGARGLQDFLRRHAGEAGAAARAAAERDHLCARRAAAGARPSLPRAWTCAPCSRAAEEVDEWAAFCGARSTSSPAAIHIDSGINRLGISSRGQSFVHGGARSCWPPSSRAGDEPSRLRRRSRRSQERGAAQRFDTLRAKLPPRRRRASPIRRHHARARLSLTIWCGRACALWRQALEGEPTPCSPWCGSRPHPAGARRGLRRDRRLRRNLRACKRPRASPSSRWAMPTASCAP